MTMNKNAYCYVREFFKHDIKTFGSSKIRLLSNLRWYADSTIYQRSNKQNTELNYQISILTHTQITASHE